MTKVKITFYNTVPHNVNNYTIHRSTTPKKVFIKEYNTTNYKRAMSYARRFVNKQREDLGRNTVLELL